jgi:hypothetical protein
MAAGLVSVMAGLAVGAAVLGGSGASQPPRAEPCAQWEVDAQALADELAGATGPAEAQLRQELAEAGFTAGGPPTPVGGGSWTELVVELLVEIIAALHIDSDSEIGVTVLGSDGLEGLGPAAPGGTCTVGAPPTGPAPDRSGRDEAGAGRGPEPSTADGGPTEPEANGPGG